MQDTSREMQQKQLEIFFAKSAKEKFLIGDQTIEFSRMMLERSIKIKNRNMSEIDLKIEVFIRCYDKIIGKSEMKKIIDSMKNYFAQID